MNSTEFNKVLEEFKRQQAQNPNYQKFVRAIEKKKAKIAEFENQAKSEETAKF